MSPNVPASRTHDMIRIRRPTAAFRGRESAPVFNLNRPVRGLRVGIRTDQLWVCWPRIAEIWSELLIEDGAHPVVLEVGDHSGGDEAQRTRNALDAWADSVDCAVVGLAN